MPIAFSRSLRSLESDGFRRSFWALALVVLLLSASCGWFLLARVAVYESSERARLEVARAAHPVAAAVGGRVMATHFALGQRVKVGDLLVELESEGERLQLEEERSRLVTTRHRSEALHAEISAEARAWPEEKSAASLAI